MTAKLADFGICISGTPKEAEDHLGGADAFRAPELIDEKYFEAFLEKKGHAASDVFSVGCALFYLIIWRDQFVLRRAINSAKHQSRSAGQF